MKNKNIIILLALLLLTLLLIAGVNAAENTTNTQLDNTINTPENTDTITKTANHTNPEALSQSNNEEKLSDFDPEYTQITITVNDTSKLETTGNITINMHFSFDAITHSGEFTSQNINIYENNTIAKRLNIGEQNLPELGIITGTGSSYTIKYQADLLFNYTIKDNTCLTTSLFGAYSNTLQFTELKKILTTNLNNTQINIDNTYTSNRSWNNSIESLKKAISLVKDNGTISLNNIQLIQDNPETITINKNITITGHNTTVLIKKTQTLLEISPNTETTLINITFAGNSNYIISNKGKLQLINCTFKDNSLGLIKNNGKLEINNCTINEINQFYQTKSNINGLITNTGTLKITQTTFNNNIMFPFNLPTETSGLKGIIYNKGTLFVDNVNFTNINYRIIYNDGEMNMKTTIMENITSTTTAIYTVSSNQQLNTNYTYNNYRTKSNANNLPGGAIYNTNKLNITDSTFKNIAGIDGGAIYNTKELTITNTTFQTITGNNGGTIYNTNKLTIQNSKINNTQSRSKVTYNGGAIYNKGECIINDSNITELKVGNGRGGLYNDATLIINNSIISKGNRLAIYNNGVLTVMNCQIINNNAGGPVYILKELPPDYVNTELTNVYAGVISNTETGKATITKTIFKDNTLTRGMNEIWCMYYGIIKNDGEMEISGCVFDNNIPIDWSDWWGGQGALNIYNTGRITVMYNYLLNTQQYTLVPWPATNAHAPHSFLYNTGQGTCNINYNFYCLNPSSIIANANPNYYFIAAFEDEYYPIKLNENADIRLTLGLTNGTDYISFNDWDKLLTQGFYATITTIDEKGEYINITTFLKDYYTFNFNYTMFKAQYPIYASVLDYNYTAIVDVGKEYPEMTVTYNNITYNDGNNITFHIKVTGNLTVQPTGNVTLSYNGKKIMLNLSDGECNYTITETLKPANYTMRIDYNGDEEYFKIIKRFYTFTVHKIPTNITITAREIKVDQKGEITITVNPGEAKLKGFLYITKGDKVRIFIADTQGSRTLYPKNFEEGIYNATVIFEEDEYYMSGSASTIFRVSRYPTNITLQSTDIKEGVENATVTITISPGDVRGDAILEINGVNQSIYINNTITPITITDLKNGTYYVNIYYPGDKKYLPSNASTVFSVSRITSSLEAELNFNEDLTGYIYVKASSVNCSGEVALYINNDSPVMLNLTNGEANFTLKFKRGTNYIYLYYKGDSYYSFSTWSIIRYIEGKPILNIETWELEEQSEGYVKITLIDAGDNPYEYTDINITFKNTTSVITTNQYGVAYYPVKSASGTYTITASYKNITSTGHISIKTPVTLTVSIPTVNADDDLMVYVTLTDKYKNGLNDYVIIEINKKYYKINIKNGKGSRNLGEFKASKYSYTVIYPGTNTLASAEANGTFTVKQNNYKITGNNIVQYYGSAKIYKIRLTNNNQPVKNAIVTVKINKNTVQIKTNNNGYATLKLNLKAGTYTVTATYKNAKTTNKITVKPTLITKNIKTKSKTLTYTAKLLNKNGKPLKNKKITFKINGKKYKAKTNKKGIAKIKIKNLKAGKHKIQTTYGKQKNTNTITVKK